MQREVTIPKQVIIEDINQIDETPGLQVRFTVGKKNNKGEWVTPQQFEIFTISGDQYQELNGPALEWCPDKPEGTYRNEDLWHYVDIARK